MPFVVAALVLLGLLCLVNLLLTVGILRRMRAQAAAGSGPLFALRPGSAVGEFAATTTDGEPLTTATLDGTVAFFSADCPACHDTLPDFLAYAREQGRDRVLAVVGGDDADTVRALAEVARVVAGGPRRRPGRRRVPQHLDARAVRRGRRAGGRDRGPGARADRPRRAVTVREPGRSCATRPRPPPCCCGGPARRGWPGCWS